MTYEHWMDKPVAEMTEGEYRRFIAAATVGLEAVIDEATGYQGVREDDALGKRYAELGGDASDYTAPDYPPEGVA